MAVQDDRDPQPIHYSQVAAAAMHDEIARLRNEHAQLTDDVAYWQHQTNHWYMRANYTPEQIAEFVRKRSKGFDDDGETTPLAGSVDEIPGEEPIIPNDSIRANGTNGANGSESDERETGDGGEARDRGNGSDDEQASDDRITRTGNLATTPKLYTGERGPYTYARILVTDRHRRDDGTYQDGRTTAYDVSIRGRQAQELVATAERDGNVRVMFSGRYRVVERVGEKGPQVRHEVRADQIGISLRGQAVTVLRPAGTRRTS